MGLTGSGARSRLIGLVALGALACDLENHVAPPATRVPAGPALGVVVSRDDAPPGALVGLGFRLWPHGMLAGAHLSLRFDPARLRFMGQVPTGTFAILNAGDASRGHLAAVMLEPGGLPEVVGGLMFEVVAPSYAEPLAVEAVELVGTGLALVERPVARLPTTVAAGLPVVPVRGALTVPQWAARLGRDAEPPIARTPGQYLPGLRYGDVTLNGAISTLDAATVANVVVGNLQLIAGTDAPARDFVVAGNVRPANLPGLGEPGDAVGPGVDADGARRLSILDAAVIATEAVGTDQDIAGELVPGRESLPSDRVVLEGEVDSGRTLTRDTIYELRGTVRVLSGVTLTVEAGTRIEGDAATRGTLVITGGADLIALGTFLQPVVFTCTTPAPAPGCWGGIVVLGHSLLNNGEGTSGGAIGCPEKPGPGGAGMYGGCLVQDDSGALRFVRIEFAGQAPPGEGPGAGLSLMGAGSGTRVDSVQVHESLGDGVFVSGGTVDLRTLVLTDNGATALRWDDGWVGRGQFVIIQQDPAAGPALAGSNAVSDPDAGPRSRPELYHVTVVGAGAGLLLERGTDLVLRDAVLLGVGGAGFDVNDAATCARLGIGIDVSASIFFGGTPDFSGDPDCADEPAFALEPGRANRVLDPLLVGPDATARDFRPLAGSPALSGFTLPPANGFYDLTALHVGAVAGLTNGGGNVPWYSGWIRVP